MKQPIFSVLIFSLLVTALIISCGQSNNLVQTKTTAILATSVTLDEAQAAEVPPTVSIHLAAWGGDLEAVKQHLAAGTDVDAKNQWRATPLLKVPREGHKAISELLINNVADLNAKNVDGKTPLDYAIENNHTNIADLLRQHGGKTGKELEAKKRHIGWQRSR